MKFNKLFLFMFVLIALSSFVTAFDYTPVHYYKFDNNYQDEVTSGRSDLGIEGTPAFTTGILGQGINLTTSDDLTNTSLSNESIIRTVEFWFDPTIVADKFYFSLSDGSNNNQIYISDDTGGTDLKIQLRRSGALQWENTGGTFAGDWQHVILSSGSNGYHLWLNGVEVSNGTETETIGAGMNQLVINDLRDTGTRENAVYDNFVLWEEEFTTVDAEFAYNSGTGRVYSLTGNLLTLLNPVDNDVTNNETVTFSYQVNGSDVVDCELYINGTLNQTNTSIIANATNYFNVEFDSGEYNWNISCDFGTETLTSDTRSLEIDLVEPIINVGNLQNKAVIGLFEGQINITDDNLYSINISDSTGDLFYNISYGGTLLQYNLSLNANNYPQGNNTITIRSADGHTAKKIKDYKYSSSIFNNDIVYEFDEGYVRINPEGLLDDLNTEKLKDRYNFKLTRNDKTKDIIFYVESNHYIDYLSNSKYDAHLVVPSLNKWIDFEIEGATGNEKYNVERLNNNQFKVTISKVKEVTDITFNSIGDLNVNEVNLTWYNAKATTSFTSSIAENQEDTYIIAVNHTGLSYDSLTSLMYFNGTEVLQDSKFTSNEITTFTYTNTAPEISLYEETKNITFIVNITQSGNTSSNQIENNQTIVKLALGDCTDDEFNTTALTVYGYNEENYNETLDFIMNADFELYLEGETSRTYISEQFSGANNYSICLRDNETDLFADATIEYYDVGGLFSNRKYYLQQYRLNVTGRELNLYLINDSLSSDITLKVVDSDGQAVSDAFVKVLRYYPELGQSFVVEIGRTDNEGKTGSKQILADPLYSYIVQTGNTIRVTTNPGRLLSTTKIFTLGREDNELESFKGLLNIDYNIYYDDTTNTFNFVWNDATGLTDTMCLEVIQRSGFKDTNICPKSNCLTANAGNLQCSLGATPSGQYFAQVYLETNTANSEYIFVTLDKLFKTTYEWGKEGILGALLLVSAGALAMTFSPIGVILGSIIGLIGAVMLSLVNIGAGFVITAIVIGVIIIARLKE